MVACDFIRLHPSFLLQLIELGSNKEEQLACIDKFMLLDSIYALEKMPVALRALYRLRMDAGDFLHCEKIAI